MKKKLLLFLILTIFSACTSQKNEISLIKENTKDINYAKKIGLKENLIKVII